MLPAREACHNYRFFLFASRCDASFGSGVPAVRVSASKSWAVKRYRGRSGGEGENAVAEWTTRHVTKEMLTKETSVHEGGKKSETAHGADSLPWKIESKTTLISDRNKVGNHRRSHWRFPHWRHRPGMG